MKKRSKKTPHSFDVIPETVDELKNDLSLNLSSITERMISIDFQMQEITSRLQHITQSVELIETQTKED